MYGQIKELEQKISQASQRLALARTQMQRAVLGQDQLLERLLLALITGGHLLLEGLPGLAKTLAVNSLARVMQASFRRIQFTPDMLPADLVGTQIYNAASGAFTTQKGPVFAHVVLADEINRAPAKVQSALLEVMQEKQVTLAGQTYPLELPFLVLATQNPIEQEGTYPLPEAQMDRFMMKLKVGYPKKTDERKLLDQVLGFAQANPVEPVLEIAEVLEYGQLASQVYLDDKIKDYILDLVDATRHPQAYGLAAMGRLIQVGASPRATLTLAIASKAWAFLQGRGFVTPQDIKAIAPDVLRHRIMTSYEAEAEEKTSDDLISRLLAEIPVP